MDPLPLSPSPKLSVIIPVFNEAASIEGVIQSIRQVQPDAEVIAIDDGSTDNTFSLLESLGVTVVRHPYNLGNGASIKAGIRQAKGEVMVFMDGDGQHRAEDIPLLVNQVSRFAMVVGERNAKGQANWSRWGANLIYNGLASYVCQFPIRDLTSGFRAIRGDLAKRFVYLLPNTFSYPSTLTLATIKSGHPICYVPINVQSRVGKSKIRVFRDGIRFFTIILKITMLFSPLRIFLPVSGLLMAGAIANYAYTFYYYHRFTNMSVLLGVSSILLFMLGLIAEQIALLRMDRSEDA